VAETSAIYIDMIKITGTINVRLLLSATPPFVRNATISFPKLPFFDISAKPLVRNAFNAMGLPGMRSYGELLRRCSASG
jgi:Ca2+-dependent lipid-binding protein